LGESRKASVAALAAAFATVYIVWGSTYLAIRLAVQTIPPLLMAGTRFLTAGTLLYALVRWRGAARPSGGEWKAAAIVGTLLLMGGNGLVCWAEQWVPSGAAALIVGTVPIWIVVLEWLFYGARRPGMAIFGGMALGTLGIVLLAGSKESVDAGANAWAIPALLLACISWAVGSLKARYDAHPPSLLLSSAMQMIGGGAALMIVGTATGEWVDFKPETVTTSSVAALAYLILIGAMVAFSAYGWLVKHASPAAVSTYAYVNPLVAVGLAWAAGDQRLGAGTMGAMAAIVAAVVLITLPKKGKPATAAALAE
jgi:drug/metabolite transporter (DMT)-like permease